MSKKIYDVVVVTGRFLNKDGVEKRKYQTIGNIFQVKQDQLMLKLNSTPIGDEHWNGWAYLNVPFEKDKPETQGDTNDDIPY